MSAFEQESASFQSYTKQMLQSIKDSMEKLVDEVSAMVEMQESSYPNMSKETI